MSIVHLEMYLKAKIVAEELSVLCATLKLTLADASDRAMSSKAGYIHAESLQLRLMIEKHLIRVKKNIEADYSDFTGIEILGPKDGSITDKPVSKRVAKQSKPRSRRKTV